jgi:hypothetical protein
LTSGALAGGAYHAAPSRKALWRDAAPASQHLQVPAVPSNSAPSAKDSPAGPTDGGNGNVQRQPNRRSGARPISTRFQEPGSASARIGRPRESGVRAATWSEGFSTKPAPNRPPVELLAPIEPPQPSVHVMPMWEPAHTDPETTQPESKRRGRPRKIASETAPTTADPFDPNDDGTNCLRCGCLVQSAREKRADDVRKLRVNSGLSVLEPF